MRIDMSEYIRAGSVASHWSLSRVVFSISTPLHYHIIRSLRLVCLILMFLLCWNMLKLLWPSRWWTTDWEGADLVIRLNEVKTGRFLGVEYFSPDPWWWYVDRWQRQVVDCKNTIINMTSNLGSEHLLAGIRGEITMQTARNLVMNQVCLWIQNCAYIGCIK
jgi:hypothetical protein